MDRPPDSEGNITTIKVYETKKEICQVNESIGTILSDGKSYIKVAITDGYLHLTSLQIPGKKRMPVADLLRGFSIEGKKIALQ